MPDIISVGGSALRMYSVTGGALTDSATSTDGRMFTLDTGIRVAPLASGDDIVDPDVIRLPDGRYRM